MLKDNPNGLTTKMTVEESEQPLGKTGKIPGGSTYAKKGDWVRNSEGIVGVVTEVSKNKVKISIPRGSDSVTKNDFRVIVKADDVDNEDSINLLQNEMRILNSPEALKLFATPTPEGQSSRKNKICLCSVDQLTDYGKDFIMDTFIDAIHGKVTAKVISVDKVGQVDLVAVRLGDNEEFPFTIAVEIHRDGDGSPQIIRMLNEALPVEILPDFAEFLDNLAKERKSESSIDKWDYLRQEIDKTEAPAKLDRCVADVMKQKVKDFRKRNGRAPNKKERQEMESSAFSICRSQTKK